MNYESSDANELDEQLKNKLQNFFFSFDVILS